MTAFRDKPASQGAGNTVAEKEPRQSAEGVVCGRLGKQVVEDVLRPIMNGAEGALQVDEV